MSSQTGTLDVGIAFSSIVEGFFYLDHSTIDGTDGLYDGNASQFGGTYTDVTSDLDGPVTIKQGTDYLGAAVQAGECDFILTRASDPGYYNPANPTSTPNLLSPGFKEMRPVKVTLTVDGVSHGMFLGFIQTATFDPVARTCTIHCEDALLWLGRVYPVITATGPTTTGAAIGLILDAAGLTDITYRNLATGDTISTFSADGTKTGLQLISDLLTAERGTCYVTGAGVFTYESRDHAMTHTNRGTITTQHIAQTAGLDVNRIVNQVTVTRTGGVAQTSTDTSSQHAHGIGTLSISTAYLPDDATALLLAEDIVVALASPSPPVTIDFENDDGTTLALLLSIGLLDQLTVTENLAGTNGTYAVEQLITTIDTNGAYVGTHLLLRHLAAADIPFRIDISGLDSTDALRY